tara:strand:- start:110 stop:349 length:240 start_codon:yes stop_codon:yes gene_type:complete
VAESIIFILGAASVWVSQGANAKYACILGLIAQPFWFYVTFIAEQWGLFALTVVYTFAWVRGINTYWRKDGSKDGSKNE